MNLTRFLSLIKYTLLVAVVSCAALFISSCDNDDDGPKTFNGTTLQLIQEARFKQSATVTADVALDSLVKYLTIYPELTTILSGTDHTLFAPSNEAFISLLAIPNFPSDIRLINPDIIKGVLSYHIIASKNLKKGLTSGVVLNSLYTDPLSPAGPQIITVNADGTLFTGSSDAAIQIVKADNLALNGVVHVTNKVLIPPSVGAVLTPILGTAAATILLGKDFSYLAFMINYADNGVATAGKVSSILANPINPTTNPSGFTVFATPNAVFEGAYNAANGQPTTNKPTSVQVQGWIATTYTGGGAGTASAVLKNHIVPGKYVVDAVSGSITFSNGATLTPLTGTSKNITVITGSAPMAPYGVGLSNTPAVATSFRPIVKKDISGSAGINNGVVQVFGGILN